MADSEGARAAVPTLRIDNDRTRVTEWSFAPGAATGYHRHEMDYVVVPGTTGRLKMIGPDGGETFAELTSGLPYFPQGGGRARRDQRQRFPLRVRRGRVQIAPPSSVQDGRRAHTIGSKPSANPWMMRARKKSARTSRTAVGVATIKAVRIT